MDFRGRMSQSSNRPAGTPTNQLAEAATTGGSHGSFGHHGGKQANTPAKLFKIGSILLLLSVAALVITLTFFVALGNNAKAQEDAINKDAYQAVFLQNGQVYFGKIESISSRIFDLTNIYYLQTSSADGTNQTAANVSLVKLGCELHAPYDRMLINTDQVIFWENIQDSSQVVKAIDDYKKQNNDKLNCTQQSQNSTQQAPTSSSNTGTGTSTTGTGTGTTSTGTTRRP